MITNKKINTSECELSININAAYNIADDGKYYFYEFIINILILFNIIKFAFYSKFSVYPKMLF